MRSRFLPLAFLGAMSCTHSEPLGPDPEAKAEPREDDPAPVTIGLAGTAAIAEGSPSFATSRIKP